MVGRSLFLPQAVAWVALVLALLSHIELSAAQPSMYCGKENCYDVLGLERSASVSEIRSTYRKLARKLHPDVNKAPDATKQFQRVATAYEVLSDQETRQDYDYMLDHPDEFYGNMYRYYRRKAAKKVDVWPTVLVSITVISIFQYYSRWSKHKRVIRNAHRSDKLRQQARKEAVERGLLGKKTKVSKEEEEEIVRQVIEENLDLRGSWAPPKLTEVLWIQLLMSPYTLYGYVAWWASWKYRIDYKGEPLTDDDKHYLLLKNFGLNEEKFHRLARHRCLASSASTPDDATATQCQPEEWQQQVWDRECWIKANADALVKEQQEEQRQKLLNSAKYKRYKRYMKKHESNFAMD